MKLGEPLKLFTDFSQPLTRLRRKLEGYRSKTLNDSVPRRLIGGYFGNFGFGVPCRRELLTSNDLGKVGKPAQRCNELLPDSRGSFRTMRSAWGWIYLHAPSVSHFQTRVHTRSCRYGSERGYMRRMKTRRVWHEDEEESVGERSDVCCTIASMHFRVSGNATATSRIQMRTRTHFQCS